MSERFRYPSVGYYVDGEFHRTRAGSHTDYTRTYSVGGTTGPARMTIRFHTGEYRGRQEVYRTHRVGSGRYVFGVNRRGYLNLYTNR